MSKHNRFLPNLTGYLGFIFVNSATNCKILKYIKKKTIKEHLKNNYFTSLQVQKSTKIIT
jgi:hypothetical protein